MCLDKQVIIIISGRNAISHPNSHPTQRQIHRSQYTIVKTCPKISFYINLQYTNWMTDVCQMFAENIREIHSTTILERVALKFDKNEIQHFIPDFTVHKQFWQKLHVFHNNAHFSLWNHILAFQLFIKCLLYSWNKYVIALKSSLIS